MAEMKRIDYEEKAKGEKAKAALNEAKLKQVNQDYADGGVKLMSEEEKKELENKKEEEWTLSKDRLWLSSKDKDMSRIQVKIERTAVPASNNFYYSVVLRDTTTGATARSSISRLNDAITELIDAGAILLYRPKNSKILQRLIDKAIEDTVGKAVGKNGEGQVTDNSHAVLGWRTVSGHDFYFGNKCIDANGSIVDSAYVGENVIRMVQQGTAKDWVEVNNNYITAKIIPSVVMISSFAGMFRQRYKSIANDTQLVINIVGESSSGKTTLVRAAHSVYTSCEEYLGYSTSLNSRTKRLALRNPIVASVDDVLQLSTLKDRKSDDINELIFSLASGMSKDRLGLYGELKEQEKFDSTVLLTSTETLMNLTGEVDVGQLSRLIELKISKSDIADDKESLNKMMESLEENCGQAAEVFAKKLIEAETKKKGKAEYEKEIKEEYDKLRDTIAVALEKEEVDNNRLANRIALIVLLGEKLKDCLGIEYNTEGIQDYLVKSVAETWKKFKRSLDATKTHEILAKYLVEYNDYFHHGIIETDKPKYSDGLNKYLGIWDKDENGQIVLKIPAGKHYRRIGGILYGIDPDSILAWENGKRVDAMDVIKPGIVEKCISYMKNSGRSVVKDGNSNYNKVTFVTGTQIMGYEFSLRGILTEQEIIDGKIWNAPEELDDYIDGKDDEVDNPQRYSVEEQ